jgi:exopolysaccharide biosynthesis polyprenyl glycosylphosphotransferase
MDSISLIKKIILFLGDIAIFLLSLWLSLIIRYGQLYSIETWNNHLPLFSILGILWIFILYSFNFYQLSYYPNLTRFASTFGKAIIVIVIASISFFYIFGSQITIAPKTIMLIDVAAFSLIFTIWRYSFYKLFNLTAFKKRILIYGAHPNLPSIIEDIKNQNYLLNIVGCYVFTPTPENNIPVPIYSLDYKLSELAKQEKIKIVILAENPKPEDLEELSGLLKQQIDVFSLPKFYEVYLQKIPVRFIQTAWFLENFAEGEKGLLEAPKRLIDFILALIGIIISLFLFPILALLIKLTSSGPIFFQQIRTGKNGKLFLAIKFRTMVVDAEKNGPQWAQKNDFRVTPIGKYLRKLRLDEIPQLFNIIRGEMSFVGPRPERPEFDEKIEQEVNYYKYRHLVKPGLTGWAQINYPYGSSIDDARIKLEYDLFYIKNRSLLLDLSIILKTINTILRGWG